MRPQPVLRHPFRILRLLLLGFIVLLISMTPATLPARAQSCAATPIPGGGTMTFVSTRSGIQQLFVMDGSECTLEQLTNEPAGADTPSLSPDGSRIAYSADGTLTVMNLADRSTYSLSAPGYVTLSGWSPDGSKLVFQTDVGYQAIYTINVDETGLTNLHTTEGADSHTPSFLPDGRILYTSRENGAGEIWVMNVDGGDPHSLFPGDTWGPVEGAAASPDGSQVAFASAKFGTTEIFVRNMDGSGEVRRLTDNTATDQYPRWSPDGTRLAYYSNRDGNLELYVAYADGSGETRVTDNAASDFLPIWGGPHIDHCYIDAPAAAYEGTSFTSTVRCNSASGVYGFQLGTSAVGDAAASAASYTPGSFVTDVGDDYIEGRNTLDNYSVTRRSPAGEAVGDFSLGSLGYTTSTGLTADSSATLSLDTLLLGDLTGAPVDIGVTSPTTVRIINRFTLTLTITSDGSVQQVRDVTASADTVTLGPETGTGTALTLHFNDIITPAAPTLSADMRSHLACSGGSVNLDPAGANPVTIELQAGDVVLNEADTTPAINLYDAVAIGLAFGTPGSGEEDVNGDGTVNIFDLIHVGRNYDTVMGACS